LHSDDINKFFGLIKDNIPYSQNVIDRMLVYYKNNFFTEINNYNNFNYFADLLIIILSTIDKKKEYLDINFAIIYIAEKTFHKNKENPYNKIYLCSILSKNKIYSDKNFWENLIDLKLSSVVESKLPTEIKRKEKEFIAQQTKTIQQQQIQIDSQKRLNQSQNHNYDTNNKELNIRNSFPNYDQNTNNSNSTVNSISSYSSSNPSTPRKSSASSNSFINMFGNRVKNFFSVNTNSANTHAEVNRNPNSSLLNINPKINNKAFDFSNIDKEKILNNLKKIESAIILREFIMHFCNFNFEISEANDLIVEFSMKYNYEQEKVCHFISLLNSNMFTIKNRSSKIPLADFRNTWNNKEFKKYMNLNDDKLIIFASSLKYMNLADYPKLMIINKNFNKKVSKILFSNLLLNYQDGRRNNIYHKNENSKKIRLGIWTKVLKIVKIKLIINLYVDFILYFFNKSIKRIFKKVYNFVIG